MFYVRHYSHGVVAQKSFKDKQAAWAYAQKVDNFDIYDSEVRHVVMSSYTMYIQFLVNEEDGVGDDCVYCRTLNDCRKVYKTYPSKIMSVIVSHWDIKAHDWEEVYDSCKAAK